jgi:hypothetical protein
MVLPNSCLNRTHQSIRDANQTLSSEREEISARVANFRATQEKFRRDRQEYYAATLGHAWSGFIRRADR